MTTNTNVKKPHKPKKKGSGIEWTGLTWNPVVGCTPVSLSPLPRRWKPSRIVAAHESTGALVGVELRERRAASARTTHGRIRLLGQAALVVLLAVKHRVIPSTARDLDVLGAVVGLVAVAVVNLFSLRQRPPQHLRGDEAVFVDVAAHVGHRVAGCLHEHIAVAGNRATALPVRIPLS